MSLPAQTDGLMRIIYSSGPPPDYIEFRYCPKDPGHWKSEGERCPVCRTKIKALLYIHAGELEDSDAA